MALGRYPRLAYRALGASAAGAARSDHALRLALQRARIAQRPEVYLGSAYLTMVLAFAVGLAGVGLVAALAWTGAAAVPPLLLVLLVPLPVAVAGAVYLVVLALPGLRAAARARDIDAKLPYALSYISTMAGAGILPDRVFEGLARQPVYGEVAAEAAWIARDLRLLGRDLVGALAAGIDRSPSRKWQDLLQGAISASTSGGDLKAYFLAKSEQFMYENRQEQQRFLDTLALLAESFVTVVVAAPLFLLVLLSVMTTFGADPRSALDMGYLLILVLLPLAQLGFVATLKLVTPEA